jgi:hypothetical protein
MVRRWDTNVSPILLRARCAKFSPHMRSSRTRCATIRKSISPITSVSCRRTPSQVTMRFMTRNDDLGQSMPNHDRYLVAIRKNNQCQRHASNAPQMAPMKDLCLKPRHRKISGMMTGETRDAGHSARVRRTDRMRFRSLSESVELQCKATDIRGAGVFAGRTIDKVHRQPLEGARVTSISRTVTKLQAWVLMRTFEQIALLVLGNPRLRIDFDRDNSQLAVISCAAWPMTCYDFS